MIDAWPVEAPSRDLTMSARMTAPAERNKSLTCCQVQSYGSCAQCE